MRDLRTRQKMFVKLAYTRKQDITIHKQKSSAVVHVHIQRHVEDTAIFICESNTN
jgi:hypothetical protein